MKRHRSARACALLVCLGATVAGTLPASATPVERVVTARATPEGRTVPLRTATEEQVVSALERAAHPLRSVEPWGGTGDLRPLDRMIGDARVVGLGEATHSSHEFFAMKHRVFRHLVETKGFRTFGLEASWSTGQRLNGYVLHGEGDPRRIMRDEFQASYLWWNNTDYLALVEWIRAYNRQHPHDPVRFMGNDVGWAGPELYDKVTGYVARAHPGLGARFTELYRGLRPAVPTGVYMEQYMSRPLAERREMAARTGEAVRLLRKQSPGADRTAYDRTICSSWVRVSSKRPPDSGILLPRT